MEIQDLVTLVDFSSAFANVKRANKLKGKNDFENDAEHSYQLALAGWYFSDSLGIQVNRQLILEYALAHDLVEVYAGDTDTFPNSSEAQQESKHKREAEALEEIKENFPHFRSLHACIERYESRADDESRIVYLLDKMLPDINILLSRDTYYKERKITFEAWEAWFRAKVATSKVEDTEILTLIEQLIQLQKKSDIFFATNTGE